MVLPWPIFLRERLTNSLSIVELLVHMDCEGCVKRIRKAISKLSEKHANSFPADIQFLQNIGNELTYSPLGVDNIEIEMEKQKVTVRGYIDRRKVLKIVRRTGRKAEFWPHPYDTEYYPYAAQYLEESTFSSTYNYFIHGHNETVHGYFPDQAYSTIDDTVVALFNDDNVHACTIQ